MFLSAPCLHTVTPLLSPPPLLLPSLDLLWSLRLSSTFLSPSVSVWLNFRLPLHRCVRVAAWSSPPAVNPAVATSSQTIRIPTITVQAGFSDRLTSSCCSAHPPHRLHEISNGVESLACISPPPTHLTLNPRQHRHLKGSRPDEYYRGSPETLRPEKSTEHGSRHRDLPKGARRAAVVHLQHTTYCT